MRWRNEGDVEEALRGLERGGLFFGFVFLWDIFFVPRAFLREDFGDDRSVTGEKSFPAKGKKKT